MSIVSGTVHGVVKITAARTRFEGRSAFQSLTFRIETDDGSIVELSALSKGYIGIEFDEDRVIEPSEEVTA